MNKSTLCRFSGTVVAMAILLMAGCNRSPGTVPVRGTVLIDGQPAPGPGSITFTVLEPASGFPATPGSARFDTGGDFVVSSGADLKGLYPGTYAVAIECWASPPRMDKPAPKSLVALKYVKPNTSELVLQIDPGQDAVDVKYETLSTNAN